MPTKPRPRTALPSTTTTPPPTTTLPPVTMRIKASPPQIVLQADAGSGELEVDLSTATDVTVFNAFVEDSGGNKIPTNQFSGYVQSEKYDLITVTIHYNLTSSLYSGNYTLVLYSGDYNTPTYTIRSSNYLNILVIP